MLLPLIPKRTELALAVVLIFTSLGAMPARAADYTWTERPDPGTRLWYGMASSDDGLKLVAAPSGGYVYTSTDAGVNWTQQTNSGSRSWSNAACSSDGTKIVAVVYGGYMYRSTDSGATWTELTAPSSRQWVGIDCTPDGTKWAACARGALIYTSSDSGATWTAQSGSGSTDWRHIAMSSDGTSLIATDYNAGYFYTSSDSGVTWTQHTDGGADDWYACVVTADGTKFAVASAYSSGYVWTSTDSGATWTEQTGSGQRTWYEFDCTPDGSVLIAGTRNKVCVSTDWGVTWTEQTEPPTKDWTGVAISSNGGKAAACAYSGTIFTGVASLTAPTVTTASVSDVTTSTATCGGNVTDDGGLSVTTRGVCWNTSGTPTTADDNTEDGSGTGAFTSDIADLDPGTTYYVRAYATNGEGTSYGSETSFETSIAVTTSDGSAAHVLDEGATVVDPNIVIEAATITDFKVSITGNFASGDVLDFEGTLPTGVTDSYSTSTGVLTLSGDATAADWQAFLRTVTFETTSDSTSTRTIAFTAGGAIPLEDTGHFYEFVASSNINWTDSRDGAEARSLFGLEGYLATITSQAENDFIRQKLGADAWIGGSDAAVEDEWRWVTGPEAGTQFSQGSTPVNGQFANWNALEPNNSGGNEDYAEIYSTDGVGKWNDLPDSGILGGYVVEYGGMPGDTTPQITDTRNVTVSTVPTVTTTAVSSITSSGAASGGNVTDEGGASVTACGVCWSTSANPTTAGETTSDGSGAGEFTSQITGLSPATTYHVRAYATNAVGTSYGADLEFTTEATTPTVTTAAVTDVTQTEATCGGEVTDDGGDTVSVRGVCWNATGTPTTADSKTEDGSGTGTFTSELSALTADTTYYVRAYATNSVGTAYGSERTFTTSPIVEPNEPDEPNEPVEPNEPNEPNEPAAAAPDLRVTIAASSASAIVGEEFGFEVNVQNLGTADATNVVLRLPLPANTEFMRAWLVTDEAAQSTPLTAYVEDGEIVIELGDVAAAQDMKLNVVLKATASGIVSLEASVAGDEQTTPATAQANSDVDVDDVYYEIVETMTPIGACGALGFVSPLLLSLGLLALKHRGSVLGRRP